MEDAQLNGRSLDSRSEYCALFILMLIHVLALQKFIIVLELGACQRVYTKWRRFVCVNSNVSVHFLSVLSCPEELEAGPTLHRSVQKLHLYDALFSYTPFLRVT